MLVQVSTSSWCHSYLGLWWVLLKLGELRLQRLDVNALLILGKRLQPPLEASIAKDLKDEVVARRNAPHGLGDVGIGEALQDAGNVLAGAARDADALRVPLDAVVLRQPCGQGFAQGLVAGVGAVLQRGDVDGGVGEVALGGRGEEVGGEEGGVGPAADEVDLVLARVGVRGELGGVGRGGHGHDA